MSVQARIFLARPAQGQRTDAEVRRFMRNAVK